MFCIHLSNDTGRLADLMLDRLNAAPPSPFEAEEIIVPSAGIQHFLELRYADRYGVAANISFNFPARWIWQMIAKVLGVPAEESPVSAEVLVWRAYEWLSAEGPKPGKRLNAYLKQSDAAMRFELAARIAVHLEQYVTYRPDWLFAWSSGGLGDLPNATAAHRDDEKWQAELWRHILYAAGLPAEHPSERMLAALGVAGTRAATDHALPRAVQIFGVPELPPLYLEILRRLAHWIDIRLYLINPCREYWFDIASPKQRARLAARQRAEHMEIGNTLLAQWGGQTKAFIELALDHNDADFEDASVEREPACLLHRVQQAILRLEEIPRGSLSADDLDASIAIHVCHSLTRELEVLHDQLLLRFREDPTLEPGEVLVVTPDLEGAAPLIDAVFGAVRKGDPRHIPYRITGNRALSTFPLTRTFLALLDLPASRFEASRLFEPLQQGALARRFALEGKALDAVHRWIRESGIRWGIDAAHRQALGVPASVRHTLDEGLKRLFLGYALPLSENSDFAGCLPYDDIEGQLAYKLGGFWRYTRELRDLVDALGQERRAADWGELLFGVLDRFFLPAIDELPELQRIREAIADVVGLAASGGAADLALPIEVVRLALEQRIGERTPGGMPSGTVTFTGMTPLRYLPYRLIGCLGMDHGAFPAAAPPDEFDLLSAFPRKGDRQRRRDDRNVFLDLLMAARDALYLSYTGRGIRDHGVLPPSVVLSDLLDYLVRAATPPGAHLDEIKAARDRLVTEHPLQPFSRRYFAGDPRLVSFNQGYCEALRIALERELAATEGLAPFFARPLPAPDPEWRRVSLPMLIGFLKQPIRFLLERRLGLGLRIEDGSLRDEEPFAIDRDDAWDFRNHILAWVLQAKSRDEIVRLARLRPEVPHGGLGWVDIEEVIEIAQSFAAQYAAARRRRLLDPYPLRLALGDFRLEGELGELRDAGLMLWRFSHSSIGAKLEAWVRHLALGAAKPPGARFRTQWLATDGGFFFEEIEEPERRLRDLLELYWEGLQRPVPFFPHSALAYVERDGDLSAASKKWRKLRDDTWAESDDPYYQLALRDRIDAALDAEFEQLAVRVFGPLLKGLKEGIHVDYT